MVFSLRKIHFVTIFVFIRKAESSSSAELLLLLISFERTDFELVILGILIELFVLPGIVISELFLLELPPPTPSTLDKQIKINDPKFHYKKSCSGFMTTIMLAEKSCSMEKICLKQQSPSTTTLSSRILSSSSIKVRDQNSIIIIIIIGVSVVVVGNLYYIVSLR